jgi:transcription elongation factor Elf1
MVEGEKSEEYKEIDIRCPNCDSDRVVVCEDSYGHFQVVQCHNCGYRKNCELE